MDTPIHVNYLVHIFLLRFNIWLYSIGQECKTYMLFTRPGLFLLLHEMENTITNIVQHMLFDNQNLPANLSQVKNYSTKMKIYAFLLFFLIRELFLSKIPLLKFPVVFYILLCNSGYFVVCSCKCFSHAMYYFKLNFVHKCI